MIDILQRNRDITHLSNYKTPAITEYYFEINTEVDVEHLQQIVLFCGEASLPFLIVSGGTNMLFAFERYPGVIIKNNLKGWNYDTDSCLLTSYSQESIREIAQSLETDYRQYLWHRFIGLPGSIGGAVFGNAGCFGLEVENNLLSVTVYNIDTGSIEVLYKEDMKFSYRSSILKENEGKYFIISVEFDLSQKIEKYHSDVDNIYFREHQQPKGNSCGSFFKNPSREQSAGYLIEQVGLKGTKIGGAFFSEKHANFLMNDGTASYMDMLNLIELAQERVLQEYGINLVNEVRIIYPTT